MGSTLQLEYLHRVSPEPPDGWGNARDESFDWNQDGAPDVLRLLGESDQIEVSWDGGAIRVSGVKTDYTSGSLFDDDGNETPLSETYRESNHVPVAVGDITGDGLPDLLASHGGHAAVLIGEGARSRSLDIAFDEMGVATLGWQEDPVRLSEHGRLLPAPFANIDVLWDLNGDGARDFRVGQKASGRTGPVELYYFGIPCKVPSA